MPQFFVNLGYLLMLVALTVRDILWLRCILVSAQISLATYALLIGNTSVALWNLLFVCMNTIQVGRILRERRPVQIPPDLSDIYQNVFVLMTPREFLDFWRMGALSEAQDTTLIYKDEPQTELSLILDGRIIVIRDGHVLSQMGRGSFIAEMSFLTGEPASADVIAKDRVHYISWQQERLGSLRQSNPPLFIKIQGTLGRDLIGKIRAASTST